MSRLSCVSDRAGPGASRKNRVRTSRAGAVLSPIQGPGGRCLALGPPASVRSQHTSLFGPSLLSAAAIGVLTKPIVPVSAVVDRVYDEWASTDEIYAITVKPLVAAVLSGEPGAVIAYGATGAGKTHTMLGGAEQTASGFRSRSRGRSLSPHQSSSVPPAGLIPMAVAELFFQIQTADEHRDRDFRIHVSYLEVYQERV